MSGQALSPAIARRQRRELWADIRRDERRKKVALLLDLRDQVRQARAERKVALEETCQRCRSERLAVRERVQALRERVLEELRQTVASERSAARDACAARRAVARGISDRIKRVRAELEAERTFQRDMRRIERANRQRASQARRATAAERRSESDDAVRAAIPEELLPLWERVKGSIRGSDRMSRAEAFLLYAEQNPSEVLEVLENRTDALVRELEAREIEAARALRGARRSVDDPVMEDAPPSSYAHDSVPF